MEEKKRLIVDLDNTITVTEHGDYVNSKAVQRTIDMLKQYKDEGFEIVVHSSRNMRTYEAHVGQINIHTLPNIINWLNNHDVPYDEVIVGKPWCGFDGFYIDDSSIRPSEFHNMTFEEISEMIKKEKEYVKSLAL